jgi:acetyltransferase-like isoleucine patch superfamily enzyme
MKVLHIVDGLHPKRVDVPIAVLNITNILKNLGVENDILSIGDNPVILPKTDLAFIREIKIGKNVFIGMGAIIMPGTTIHDNVVIGAGSVVRGEIPTDSIVIGNPGKIIGNLTEKARKWELQIKDSFIQTDRK